MQIFPLNSFKIFLSEVCQRICCCHYHFKDVKKTQWNRPQFLLFLLFFKSHFFIFFLWNSFLHKQILHNDNFCWTIGAGGSIFWLAVIIIYLPSIAFYPINLDRIGGPVVSVLASSAVDRGFEPRSGQTKDYKIGICCFSAQHASLRRKSKDGLTRDQNNVFEWSELLFQWASTMQI
jgi:hypothetical protein